KVPLVTQPHIPIDVIFTTLIRTGSRINFLVLVEQADAGVAIVTAMDPRWFADAPSHDGLTRFPIRVAGSSIRSDLKSLLVSLDSIPDLKRLFDRVGHRFLAIDM